MAQQIRTDVPHRTQGIPISDGDEVLVVDEAGCPVDFNEVGELLTRGPYTLRTYYNAGARNDLAFTDTGFYRTGDLVRRLPSGHLQVVGRSKDQVNKGGRKVDATEVEGRLLEWPTVLSAAVIAEPTPTSERVLAVLMCRDTPPTLKQIRTLFRERGVSDYKAPDRIVCVDTMPRTAVGKVDKVALRASILKG